MLEEKVFEQIATSHERARRSRHKLRRVCKRNLKCDRASMFEVHDAFGRAGKKYNLLVKSIVECDGIPICRPRKDRWRRW